MRFPKGLREAPRLIIISMHRSAVPMESDQK